MIILKKCKDMQHRKNEKCWSAGHPAILFLSWPASVSTVAPTYGTSCLPHHPNTKQVRVGSKLSFNNTLYFSSLETETKGAYITFVHVSFACVITNWFFTIDDDDNISQYWSSVVVADPTIFPFYTNNSKRCKNTSFLGGGSSKSIYLFL